MIFPRVAAALFVLLLVGMLAAACIGGLALFGPMLTHGNNVEHADGKIVSIGPGRNFVLETESGMPLHFKCGSQCHASLLHIQRHLRESAHTDVYYVTGAKNTLLAVDVD